MELLGYGNKRVVASAFSKEAIILWTMANAA